MHTIVVLEGDQTGRSSWRRPCASSPRMSWVSSSSSLASTSRWGTGGRPPTASCTRRPPRSGARLRPQGGDDHARDRGRRRPPNRILREEIGGKVIVRTGRRIPGVVPLGGVHAPISVVRMAVGDAYGATEWREGAGDDEVALRTERIERRICHAVAEFAFRQAERMGARSSAARSTRSARSTRGC